MGVPKSSSMTRNKSARLLKNVLIGSLVSCRQSAWALASASLLSICLMVVCASPLRSDSKPQSAPQPDSQSAATPSQQVNALFSQGEERLAQKDFAAAEADFRQALQSDPSLALAHRELGVALWAQGHGEAAVNELSQAVRLDPRDARAHYILGQVAWALQQLTKSKRGHELTADNYKALALTETQKAVSLNPGDFNMLLDLAELSLDAGQKNQAQTEAEQAVRLAASANQRSLAHVALAHALFATDDEDRARAEYQKAIQEDSSNGEAYLGLGQLSLFQQKSSEALGYFEQAIHASPNMGAAYAAAAEILEKTHQPAEARAMLEKAVALDPEDWHSQYQLAVALMKAGETPRAKDLLTNIATQRPDFFPAREQLALMLLRQGNASGAIAQGQGLVAENSRAVEGHRVLALALWRERQTDESLAECAQALAADPRSTAMLALQALELWQEKRKNDARTALREAGRENPQIISPIVFCQLIVCSSQDAPLVDDFLRSNRWILAPPPSE